ncbi:MAG TPA: hypothetical protein VNP98_07040 [Chthoniobacterales bacterium]|nr:hypothetical protein [Chthoniobacterales bacterium]
MSSYFAVSARLTEPFGLASWLECLRQGGFFSTIAIAAVAPGRLEDHVWIAGYALEPFVSAGRDWLRISKNSVTLHPHRSGSNIDYLENIRAQLSEKNSRASLSPIEVLEATTGFTIIEGPFLDQYEEVALEGWQRPRETVIIDLFGEISVSCRRAITKKRYRQILAEGTEPQPLITLRLARGSSDAGCIGLVVRSASNIWLQSEIGAVSATRNLETLSNWLKNTLLGSGTKILEPAPELHLEGSPFLRESAAFVTAFPYCRTESLGIHLLGHSP